MGTTHKVIFLSAIGEHLEHPTYELHCMHALYYPMQYKYNPKKFPIQDIQITIRFLT